MKARGMAELGRVRMGAQGEGGDRPLRIAQIAPLHESVPPQLYGGTERVVSWLTEELVRQGHDVTLFASGDSATRAELVACAPRALRLDPEVQDQTPHHVRMLDELFSRQDEFDLLHFHLDYLHFPLAARQPVPHITTQHGRLDLPDIEPLFRRFRDAPMVSISDAQRAPLPFLNWRSTVYHGLPQDLLSLQPRTGQYLAFLGRISPEKGADRAIEIAKRAGIPLKIAAKVARPDEDYFHRCVEPLLDTSLVEFVGEIGDADKGRFLGDALALVFPIDWPEPFGLVMIEAMACGTPVIAFRRGSVEEVMSPGVSGYVVDGLDEAVARARDIEALSRPACRAYFDRRFTAARMARDYVAEYRRLIAPAAAAVEDSSMVTRPPDVEAGLVGEQVAG